MVPRLSLAMDSDEVVCACTAVLMPLLSGSESVAPVRCGNTLTCKLLLHCCLSAGRSMDKAAGGRQGSRARVVANQRLLRLAWLSYSSRRWRECALSCIGLPALACVCFKCRACLVVVTFFSNLAKVIEPLRAARNTGLRKKTDPENRPLDFFPTFRSVRAHDGDSRFLTH